MQRTSFALIAHRIIVFYCFFYAIVKVIALFKGVWFYPNITILLGLLVLGALGAILLFRKQTSLIFVVIGVVLISLLRYYESSLLVYLHDVFM